MPKYAPVDPKQSFPALEESVLERWRERDVFARQLADREGSPTWSFYEGPPTANGRPGSHHVLARVFKDIYPRYKAMQGHYVPRKAGWDCHGLPVELEVEKELGISSKEQIEEFGIAEFNQRCRDSVFRYVDDWRKLTERIGFWVDMDDPYRTLDNDYIESVWWSLRQNWDKDRLYQGHKVVPYCPRCGTALSSHEVALGYEDQVDPSRLRADAGDRRRRLGTGERRLARRLDHHAVDADLTRGDRRRRRHRLRAGAAARIRRGRRGRQAARRPRARRGLGGARLPARLRARGRPLRGAVRLHPRRGLRPARPLGPARRLRHDRGRHRPGPHRARLRRGRLQARRGQRHDAAEPGAAERPLRLPGARLPGQAGLRPQPRDRRGAPRERPPVQGPRLRARLPALLALRHRAPLLREVELVPADLRGQGPDARRERGDRLAPGAHQARALRPLAGEQRRLGALARALLGNAPPGLGMHRRRLRRALLRRLDRRPPASTPSTAARCPTTSTVPTSTSCG